MLGFLVYEGAKPVFVPNSLGMEWCPVKKGWLWTGAIAAVIGLGAGTAGGYALYGNEERYATLPEGLTIGGLPVGGLTADEALVSVRSRIRALETTEVAIDGKTVAGLREGGDGDAEAVAAALGGADDYNGDVAASAGGYSGDATATSGCAGGYNGGMSAASGSGLAPDTESDDPHAMSARTLKQLGMTVDASEAIGMLEAYRDASWRQRGKMRESLKPEYDVKVSWNEATFEKEADAAWGALARTEGRNAARAINDRDEVVYTPETSGTSLDTEALMASLEKLAPKSLAPGAVEVASTGLQALGVELPVSPVPPKITEASLKEDGIDRKIAEFTTSFATSAEGRSHNVAVTAKALDGTLLMPGDVFDYGQIVAKAEKEYGYKEAPVIVNGKLTPGVGGGICQVSSTLYNAVIRAEGLDIVERRNHSLPVHYLPIGLDATFADGYINFRFRNSTGKQLLIKTEVKDKQLTVKLFGTMDERVSYQIETVQKKVVAPKVVYVADGKIELGKSQVRQSGETGYVIETYRVKYIDGKFAEREKLATSTYRSQDEIVAVNSADPRVEPSDAGDNKNPPSGGDGPVEPV